MQQNDRLTELDASVRSAIKETERYYREQIFSSGCSSIVPIFRICANIRTAEELLRQLDGSPYIQSYVEFSERVIENLLEVDVYRYDRHHFFVNGALNPELTHFIEDQCVQVDSFSQMTKVAPSPGQKDWGDLDKKLSILILKYPVLNSLDCQTLVKSVMNIIDTINFEDSIDNYLSIFSKSELGKKFTLNQSVLLCMVAMGQALYCSAAELRELVMLGLLKDIGYARLNEQIDDFEVMHPLISHKILLESNAQATDDSVLLSQSLVNAVLLHHEFVDSSGPLARMRHPIVTSVLSAGMPAMAQISGICDLYFGFLEKYSSGVAYAITCGFVLGQGDLPPRYDPRIIEAFMSVLQAGSCGHLDMPEEEAAKLMSSILNVLKDPTVKNKANGVILTKSNSWYERITLALNIVRNIALRQPTHMCENSLVGALYLPLEFGLNY